MKRGRVVWAAVLLSTATVLFGLGYGMLGGEATPVSAARHPLVNCNALPGNRCYGDVTWGGADAAGYKLVIGQVECPNCNQTNMWGVVRTMWLYDNTSWAQNNGCPTVKDSNGNTLYSGCWIENGLVDANSSAGGSLNCVNGAYVADCYYMADRRPCMGGGYSESYGSNVSGDYGGTTQSVYIQRDSSYQDADRHQCPATFNDSWSVVSTRPNGTTGIDTYSVDNTMDPKQGPTNIKDGGITVGAEVVGSGQVLNETHWTYNSWGIWNNGIVTWQFQGWNGDNGGTANVTPNTCMSAYWHAIPGPGNSGGDWQATCSTS